MQTSNPCTNALVGLLAVQRAGSSIANDAKNSHLHNSYASLGGVRNTVVPILAANGCVVMQPLTADGERVSITTRITHAATGEYVESTVSARAMNATKGTNQLQAMGSTISYLRRYGLLAMLGLATTDDNGSAGIIASADSIEKARQRFVQGASQRLRGAKVAPKAVRAYLGPSETWAEETHAGRFDDIIAAWGRGEIVGFPESGTNPGVKYILTRNRNGVQCTCEGFRHRSKCKHVDAFLATAQQAEKVPA